MPEDVEVVDRDVPVEETAEQSEESEQITVSIGDEPEEAPSEKSQPAPEWVKKVRHRNRELEKELRDARQKLQELSQPKESPLGPKPTIQAFDFDTEKYERELAAWFERKRKADEREAAAKAEAEKAEQNWRTKLASYNESKASFKADDFDEAESVASAILDNVQQGIIVQGAVDPALLVYALGKNEKKAKELAAIKDPVQFAFAVAKLEGQLKVNTRKPTTAPESRITGNSRPSSSVDSTLDRLREEASRTGDYTKVAAYKRSKRS